MLGLGIFTGGESEAIVDAYDILGVVESLKSRYPIFKEKLCDPKTGKLYPGFDIFVNGRPTLDEKHVLKDGDVVTIVPIFAGG
ncbi:MAG: MoaD/ThiS family protein [Nitrososphaerales archaeon]